MGDHDLMFSSATELADLVRAGTVSATELTTLALARIDALDDGLNAFCARDDERALATASAIGAGDGRPFAGVPLAIKDIGVFAEGLPFTCGSELFGEFTPTFDSAVVRRFKEAGFVIVGKTNSPEMGITPVTESRRYGPTRNPWDTERTPGGSSGGAAAAVAAGMLPVAHGSDGGGSLRIPAACCGLVGLKASRGRVSYAPLIGDSMLVTEGALTRTVEDAARLLDVLAGYEPGDATWAPPPDAPFAAAVGADPGALRVGVTTVAPIDVPVDPLCAAAATETAALLAELGHEVEEIAAPWPTTDFANAFTDLWSVMVSTLVEFGGAVSGREPTEQLVEPLTWELYQRARGLGAISLASTITQLQALARMTVAGQAAYDLIVTPALAQRPVPIGAIDAKTAPGMAAFARAIEFTPFTATVNLTGQPAIALPTGIGPDGLPTAVQLIGRPAGEATLLAVAAQLETARPWRDLRPPV